MFKNCVFKVSVDTKRWMKKAGIRAIKTVAQTAVATIGTAGRCEACGIGIDSVRNPVIINQHCRITGM